MTEPTPDALSVILARMEVKLDNALAEQARHSSTLDRHDVRITKLENRATALETVDRAQERQQTHGMSRAQVVWAAIAALATVGALVLAVILAVHGGN